MNKKQFFENFVSPLSDNSGQKLDSFRKIQDIFASIKSNISHKSLLNEFEILEKEILFHIWMFEQVANGEMSKKENEQYVVGPLIVIGVGGEILFVNKAYCESSGLSPAEIQYHGNTGTLYSQIYDGKDLDQAQEAVSRLHSGKGYKHLELFMKNSHRRISWNSYGGVGAFLEIRSGREIRENNNQEKERNRFYQGSIMNSAKLLEKLFLVSINVEFSEENKQYVIWIGEYLSMFDFLWNHSEFFMEIINIPTTKTGEISGFYNKIYAQFLKFSFEEGQKFKKILSMTHGEDITKVLETKKNKNIICVGEHTFSEKNKCPVAQIYWQYSIYHSEVSPGYEKIFCIGTLLHKIQRKNIFIRIYHSLFRKN